MKQRHERGDDAAWIKEHNGQSGLTRNRTRCGAQSSGDYGSCAGFRRAAPSCGIGRPCGLLPRWSTGISTHANAVNAADTRMSGARRLWKACSYRNDPTLSAKEGARLVTDIRAAKAKPSDRLGQ